MRILMVASEALPYAKTGGLADVLFGLPRALARIGHHVDVVMPRHRGIPAGVPLARVGVPLGGRTIDADVTAHSADGVRTVLVDHAPYFDRDRLYGDDDGDYPDNPARFAFLAQAALTWGLAGPPYDVVHAHDWQAGLVPVLLDRMCRTRPQGRRVPVVLTIHNLAYQGVFDADWLPRLGLGWDLMRIDAMEYWGRISFLKAGIAFSHLLTTVSPRYAQEIQTEEFGCGFDGILRERSADLVGILNGIDYDQWDPARDSRLPRPFSASNLEGKAEAKRAVLARYGLPLSPEVFRRPLVAMISRMVDQKGLDLVAGIVADLPRLDASFVVLGTGERRYEEMWRGLAARHPDRVGVQIGFDEDAAHLIEGGADLFLMPSRFEPCGLNQMYSQRYGTVPVVRATGGLYDTVRDVDGRTGEGTGFTFTDCTPPALLAALRRALRAFVDRTAWRRIQVAGMTQDFSWEHSARRYVAAYEQAGSRVRGDNDGI